MDLLVKVAILVIVLVAIAGVAFYIFVHQAHATPLNQAQAQQTVLNDIKDSSPTATVTVVSVSPSTYVNDSWNIVLSVVYNATKPCPTLSIESFDYPATGLVPSSDNLYATSRLNSTTGMTQCIINGLSDAPTYVISSPEIAISRAYSANVTELSNYIRNFGYNNIYVYAMFYPNLSASMTPLNLNYNNVWLVNSTAHNAPYNEYVLLGQNGQIIANYTK